MSNDVHFSLGLNANGHHPSLHCREFVQGSPTYEVAHLPTLCLTRRYRLSFVCMYFVLFRSRIGDNIRRPADSAARYGGEEFIVVLPETPTEGARHIAEKIRSAISGLSIEHAGSEFGRVTASIGLATWSPDIDCDVSAVIRVADEALYNAKATGRNKVVFNAVFSMW